MRTYRLNGEQSEVDAAIQQLKNLKAEADVAQKVSLVPASRESATPLIELCNIAGLRRVSRRLC